MATRVNYDATHAVSYPSKIKSQNYGHIFNIQLTSDTDNGAIVGRGSWLDLDLYEEAEASGFEGIIRKQAANGNWYVEVTKCDPTTSLYVYMPAFIEEEWTKSFKNEKRFFNASGSVARGFELSVGDIYELSAEGFDGTPEAGKTVTVANKKLVVA